MAQPPDAPGEGGLGVAKFCRWISASTPDSEFRWTPAYARSFGLSRESFRCSLTSEFPSADITELADPRG